MSETLEAQKRLSTIERSRLLSGPIVGPMIGLALPLVVVLVTQTLVGVAETVYIGWLGTDRLAGATLVFPLVMLMTMMSNGGIGGGVSSAIARAVGAGRRDDAEALVWHSLLLSVVFGILFTVGAVAYGPKVYAALGARDAVLDSAVRYSAWLFAASIPIWTTNLLAAALRGVGNVKFPAAITLAGCIILVGASPLAIFGFGPVKGLGIAGAGLATGLYYVTACAVLLVYMRRGRGGLALRITPLRWRHFADILGVGLISAVGTLLANLTVVILTGLAGRFGSEAIAGYGTASRLDYLQIPFLFGLGTAVVTMVGMNVGAGHVARARRIAWIGAGLAAIATEAMGLTVAAFPNLWNGLFTRDAAVLAVGASYLHRVAPAYGMVGAGMLLYFAAQGVGRMTAPFIAGATRLLTAACGGGLAVVRFGYDLPTLFLFAAAGSVLFGVINAIGTLTLAPSRRERLAAPRASTARETRGSR